MEISIHYFGMIAEATKKDSELLQVENNCTVEMFTETICGLYPQLQGYVFQIALNQKVVDPSCSITEGDELAIMPPFAGG